MIKYTFLLPAYKSKFFAEALQSIKGQTYRDFKVIVSDDCSPEDLKSIYDKEVGDDSRFTYRRNEENMGSKSLVSHWNMLVDMCDTEYLIMASDDDVYESNYLEEIESLTQNFPSVNLFRSRVRMIDENGELLGTDIMLEPYQEQLTFVYHFFCHKLIKCIANYTIRTSAIKKIGGFYDFPLAWGSDDATMLLLCKDGICHTPSIDLSFRFSGINISATPDNSVIRKKSKARILFMQFLRTYLIELSHVQKSKIDTLHYRTILYTIRKGPYMEGFLYAAEISPFKEMRTCYQYLKQEGILTGHLDKIHFIWSWLRAYKVRKNS